MDEEEKRLLRRGDSSNISRVGSAQATGFGRVSRCGSGQVRGVADLAESDRLEICARQRGTSLDGRHLPRSAADPSVSSRDDSGSNSGQYCPIRQTVSISGQYLIWPPCLSWQTAEPGDCLSVTESTIITGWHYSFHCYVLNCDIYQHI